MFRDPTVGALPLLLNLVTKVADLRGNAPVKAEQQKVHLESAQRLFCLSQGMVQTLCDPSVAFTTLWRQQSATTATTLGSVCVVLNSA